MESEPTAKPTHKPTASPLADEDEDEEETAKPTHKPTSSPVSDVFVVSSSEPTVQGHPTERPTYTVGDNPPPPSITNEILTNESPSASSDVSRPSEESEESKESEESGGDTHPTASKVSDSKGPWLTDTNPDHR